MKIECWLAKKSYSELLMDKPTMVVSNDELKVRFADKLTFLNGPMNTGLNFITMCALFLYQARTLGATLSQMQSVVLGERYDAERRTKFSQARGIAQRWVQSGLPEQIRAANSSDGAYIAAKNWLASQGVRSQEALGYWFSGRNTDGAYSTQLARTVNSALGSIRNYEAGMFLGDGGHSAEELARALIEGLSPESAKEFYDSTFETFRQRFPTENDRT